ncbi:MAG TPA: uroporphyrinogen-III C-methyltransferase [Ottowia sp.]|uniref:uroporphyrinogen-III C-methyltransferase n=1 Tax=Ottowia sp. TaxID=1898956 RepID=UPI002C04D3F3|nr:uroporphyrinogen-III C-methyltransferase [Ottowia sp.]HMN21510.1 uroporphyrinogen-III C-methyltransferase [Ottowia sp.]
MTPEPQSASPPPVAPQGGAISPVALVAPRAPGLGLWLAWGLAALALALAVLLWQKVSAMQEQLARQSSEAVSHSVEARTLARQAETEVRDALGKLAALDGRVTDLAAYRAQMEELVRTVARARDENLAADLEASLRLAQDQAQLTGSPQPLLLALRSADRRLARAGDPRLAPVVRAVARDLERIQNASTPDTAGLLARIDQLLRDVDKLPVANAVGPGRAAAPPDEEAPERPSWWRRWLGAVADEARALVRVSRVEQPDASMLSPEQAFFVRENLKLRLQGARLAILVRQYDAARADLSAASRALGTWFDTASRRTQAAATLLQQIQGGTRAAELPRLDDTLVALANAMAAAER